MGPFELRRFCDCVIFLRSFRFQIPQCWTVAVSMRIPSPGCSLQSNPTFLVLPPSLSHASSCPCLAVHVSLEGGSPIPTSRRFCPAAGIIHCCFQDKAFFIVISLFQGKKETFPSCAYLGCTLGMFDSVKLRFRWSCRAQGLALGGK